MKIFNVLLSSISDVKQFVSAACDQPFDIDVIAGRYVLDAKSIMGIFSVDLSRPVRVEIHGTEEDGQSFYDLINKLVVPEVE